MFKDNWYSEKIEEPLREIIKHLRNKGINTECSCGHDLYIQCQYIPDNDVKELYDLVYHWLVNHQEKINFNIKIEISVIEGVPYPTMEIRFNPEFGSLNKELIEERIKHHEEMLEYFKKRLL